MSTQSSGNDFRSGFDLELLKRCSRSWAGFKPDVREVAKGAGGTVLSVQLSLKGRDLLSGSFYCTVNSFVGNQNAAEDPDFLAFIANPRHKTGRIVDAGVLVENDDACFHGHILAIFGKTDQSGGDPAE